jgi:hypothetical protein
MPVFALLRDGLGLAGWSLALGEVAAILALAQRMLHRIKPLAHDEKLQMFHNLQAVVDQIADGTKQAYRHATSEIL